jgi:hypothetical protein
VCRQMHAETNVLLLQRTELYFTNAAVMAKILNQIVPRQRKEISMVRLHTAGTLEQVSGIVRFMYPIENLDNLKAVTVESRHNFQVSDSREHYRTVIGAVLGNIEIHFGHTQSQRR